MAAAVPALSMEITAKQVEEENYNTCIAGDQNKTAKCVPV